MKISNIKVGQVYSFKNIDSWVSRYDGEEIIVRDIIGDDTVIVDFTNARWYKLGGVKGGEPMIGISISPKEVRKAK